MYHTGRDLTSYGQTDVLTLEDFRKPCYTVKTAVRRFGDIRFKGLKQPKPFRRNEVSPTEKRGIKIAAQNRKAFHDYFVEDKYEAGIELAGTEVKSIRAGTLNLKDSYCTIKDGELFVHSMHISPYEKGNIFNKDPVRTRRLLMHKREIRKLHALIKQDGYTLVPLSVYFKDARVKVEIGLCKGKKNYYKRAATDQRDARREIDRTMKERNR